MRVANLDGGFAKTQAYDRLFLIAGMGHCSGVGTAQGTAERVLPPMPTQFLFRVLGNYSQR